MSLKGSGLFISDTLGLYRSLYVLVSVDGIDFLLHLLVLFCITNKVGSLYFPPDLVKDSSKGESEQSLQLI